MLASQQDVYNIVQAKFLAAEVVRSVSFYDCFILY